MEMNLRVKKTNELEERRGSLMTVSQIQKIMEKNKN